MSEMVHITINKQPLEVPAGTRIIEAAKMLNIDIPHLCYHPDQTIKAHCRMCMVEVVGSRKLTAACSTVVWEGMEVITDSKKVYDAQTGVLDLILSDHKTNCLSCARNGSYIPEAAAYYVAERLGVKPTQVYDVISFYTALHDKPRAKFTLEVCSSAPCRVKDSDTLLERLKRLLNLEVGQVTYDGRFSIEQVPCFGACDVSPAVRVNGVVYGHLDSEERILDMLQQLN